MSKEYIASAETVEAAVATALSELGVEEDKVLIQVLEEPGKKLFGGRKDAVVKLTVQEPKEESKEALAGTKEEIQEQIQTVVESPLELDSLSEDQIDAIADAGIEHLKELISYLSDSDVSIEEFEGDEGEIILDVTGEDAGVLIGRHGRTIDALQAVVSSMTTKKTGIRYPLSVDVEGYKHRRKQKVVDIARRAADKSKRTNQAVSLKSMTPQERRIVHMTIRGIDGVSSTSEGSGSYRHVVILPS